MTEVEIFWPSELSADPALEAAETLRSAGVETTCRAQPSRRGVETMVLVLITTNVLEPILKAVFERVGESAFEALQSFVRRLLHREPSKPAAPAGVVFESDNGARFVFRPDLPDVAFRQAIELPQHDGTRWTWDADGERWVTSTSGERKDEVR